jgi:hypothetical protein
MRTQIAQRFGDVGPASAPLYLGPTTTLPDGLRATVTTPADGRVKASIVVGILAGLVVGALFFVVRMLARRAALERAERVLESEWRAFDAARGPS